MELKAASLFLLLPMLMPASLKAQHLIFQDDFEQAVLRSEWRSSPGDFHGVIEVYPTKILEGNYAVRLGKRNDGKLTLNQLDLVLDLSMQQEVYLEFDIYGNYEGPHVQDGIFISADGVHFEKVFGFEFARWPQKTKGKVPPLNLSRLAAIHRMSLSENFIIRFQQYDEHDFIGSENFSSGIYLDNIRVISRPQTYAALPFHEDFENGKLGECFAIGNPRLTDPHTQVNLTGVVEVVWHDSLRGHVVRLGNTMDKQYHTNALDLHLNLAGQENVMLSFMVYDNQDETHEQDGLFFSNNGGLHFTKIYDFDPGHWKDQFFGQLPPLNISQLARQHGLRLTEQCIIRFQQYDDDDFSGSHLLSDGILLDDISVQVINPSYATLPFEEHFETDTLAAHWRWGNPLLSDISGEVTTTGIVEVVSLDDQGEKAVRLGSLTDKVYTTNALDLYVNLEMQEQATLSFSILDHYDETHEQDGLFFSNDGGLHFTKVYDFDPANWDNQRLGRIHPLNIKKLAEAKGIALTKDFVIRFQQYDDDDFEGTRTISDGFYLDNIIIKNPEVTYATLPFLEEFENDSLDSFWQLTNASGTAPAITIKPDGFIGLVDTVSHTGKRSLAMGKLNDGSTTTNALDLYLRLAQQETLQLSFWLNNNWDKQEEADGIWFSQDGGRTFKKGYNFDLTTQEAFHYYALDLDALISSLGMTYTDQFVIRFQQSGGRCFSGKGNLREGIFLDDLNIAPRTIPFTISVPPGSNETRSNLPDDPTINEN